MTGSIYFVRLNEWLIQCIFILLLANRSDELLSGGLVI
jgi:hypothetical protein